MQGPSRRCGDIATECHDGWSAALVDDVRQHDHIGIGRRVDPQRGAGEAALAEAADWENHAAR